MKTRINPNPARTATLDRARTARRGIPPALKRKVAFALLMGLVTTGIVSFVLISVNIGFRPGFPRIWLRSWGIGYALAIPAILLIGPRVEALVARLVPIPGKAA